MIRVVLLVLKRKLVKNFDHKARRVLTACGVKSDYKVFQAYCAVVSNMGLSQLEPPYCI